MESITVNKERASALFQLIDYQWDNNYGLLTNKDHLIENQVPTTIKKGSEEHARFLFFTALNDHGLKSKQMYEKSQKLYEYHSEYYDPEWIVRHYSNNNYTKLIPIICSPLGARYPNALSQAWVENATLLYNDYQSSVRKLFLSDIDAKKLLRKLLLFRGVGNKIGGMLLRAALTLHWTDPNIRNVDNVLVPVDIHDSRIMFLTDVFVKTDQLFQEIDYYSYRQLAQKTITDICRQEGLDWTKIDRSLWLIGSTGCSLRNCVCCPIIRMCTHKRTLSKIEKGTERVTD